MIKAYFFDSSALVKRYVREMGSVWVQTVTAPQAANQLILSRITWVEVLSAFARLQREDNLSFMDVTAVTQAFQYDFDTQYQVVELDRSLIHDAGKLVQRHPLRAYDSVQLASALKLQPILSQFPEATLTFVTADKRLLTIAQAEGLIVDNPNDYS
ncbi:MAG: type II toxin-antitoxin system VapC family toxin [Anaerolinea sp.]|nr:type II toxin-antitoxin system VapC family toxin [Anaerolinea sp.]